MSLQQSDFNGKTVIVTGAGQGIGWSIAQAFLVCGATVIAVDMAAEGINALAATHKSVIPLVGDITDPQLLIQLDARLNQRELTLHSLINNAGLARGKPAHETSDEEFTAYYNVNVLGLFRLSKWAVARMQKTGGGSIVNTASIFAVIGAQKSAGYSASKAAVAGLTRQMATDYGPDGIRINAVAPGLIETPLTAERIQTEQWRRSIMIEQCPLRRVGKPEDIARVVRFLASDEAAFMTGQILSVDGGWAMGRYPREG